MRVFEFDLVNKFDADSPRHMFMFPGVNEANICFISNSTEALEQCQSTCG